MVEGKGRGGEQNLLGFFLFLVNSENLSINSNDLMTVFPDLSKEKFKILETFIFGKLYVMGMKLD